MPLTVVFRPSVRHPFAGIASDKLCERVAGLLREAGFDDGTWQLRPGRQPVRKTSAEGNGGYHCLPKQGDNSAVIVRVPAEGLGTDSSRTALMVVMAVPWKDLGLLQGDQSVHTRLQSACERISQRITPAEESAEEDESVPSQREAAATPAAGDVPTMSLSDFLAAVDILFPAKRVTVGELEAGLSDETMKDLIRPLTEDQIAERLAEAVSKGNMASGIFGHEVRYWRTEPPVCTRGTFSRLTALLDDNGRIPTSGPAMVTKLRDRLGEDVTAKAAQLVFYALRDAGVVDSNGQLQVAQVAVFPRRGVTGEIRSIELPPAESAAAESQIARAAPEQMEGPEDEPRQASHDKPAASSTSLDELVAMRSDLERRLAELKEKVEELERLLQLAREAEGLRQRLGSI